jgi:hypothetical protein
VLDGAKITVRTCCCEPATVASDPSTSHTSASWSRGSALVSLWEGPATATRSPWAVEYSLESASHGCGRNPATAPFAAAVSPREMLCVETMSRSRGMPQRSQTKIRMWSGSTSSGTSCTGWAGLRRLARYHPAVQVVNRLYITMNVSYRRNDGRSAQRRSTGNEHAICTTAYPT